MPKIPHTPRGPGVGGTREWVITRPAARATPSPMTDFFVAFEIAFAIGERTTKPESQKIGIDTRKPVRHRASSSLFLPKSFRKVNAIRLAAPVASNICPIITPKPMMIPMLPRVLPNPPVMELTIPNVVPSSSVVFESGMPPTTPTITVQMISARNACTFVLSTRKISTTIPIKSPISILLPSSPPIITISSFRYVSFYFVK